MSVPFMKNSLVELTDNGNGWLVFTPCAGPAPRLFVNADGIYLTDVQVTELHTALGEWLASTAPEPEAPEPVAPELIAGRRYRVGPNPTFFFDGGREMGRYLSEGAVVELVAADVNAEGNATVSTSGSCATGRRQTRPRVAGGTGSRCPRSSSSYS